MPWHHSLGRVLLQNRMIFLKNSEWPLTHPPHFWEIMLQFFIWIWLHIQGGMRASMKCKHMPSSKCVLFLFLSDQSPIIGYACHSLTHSLTHWLTDSCLVNFMALNDTNCLMMSQQLLKVFLRRKDFEVQPCLKLEFGLFFSADVL